MNGEPEKRRHGKGYVTTKPRNDGTIYPTWFMHYRWDGKQHRMNTHVEIGKNPEKSKRKAENVWDERLKLLAAGKVTHNRVKVSEWYDDERAYLLDEGKKKTAAWLNPRWDLRLKEAFGDRLASEIRLADLVHYRRTQM